MIDDNAAIQKHNGWYCCDLQPQGPRSRAFYYSRNSLLHTWITYYTELPMKVPITLHRLENSYNAPPPIAITGNRLTPVRLYRAACNTSSFVALQCWTISAPICLIIVSLLLSHGNPIFEPVCVFLPFPLLPLLVL